VGGVTTIDSYRESFEISRVEKYETRNVSEVLIPDRDAQGVASVGERTGALELGSPRKMWNGRTQPRKGTGGGIKIDGIRFREYLERSAAKQGECRPSGHRHAISDSEEFLGPTKGTGRDGESEQPLRQQNGSFEGFVYLLSPVGSLTGRDRSPSNRKA